MKNVDVLSEISFRNRLCLPNKNKVFTQIKQRIRENKSYCLGSEGQGHEFYLLADNFLERVMFGQWKRAEAIYIYLATYGWSVSQADRQTDTHTHIQRDNEQKATMVILASSYSTKQNIDSKKQNKDSSGDVSLKSFLSVPL